jgi:hypothetical protein
MPLFDTVTHKSAELMFSEDTLLSCVAMMSFQTDGNILSQADRQCGLCAVILLCQVGHWIKGYHMSLKIKAKINLIILLYICLVHCSLAYCGYKALAAVYFTLF